MTPLSRYEQDLLRPDFHEDPAQRMAVEKLQHVFEQLIEQDKQEQKGFARRLLARLKGDSQPKAGVKGLYFWGGVGRGKTYLMDTFFDCLPFEQKLRSHFHRFMQYVHDEMKALDGQKNPLDTVAKKIADQYRVICFDEFFVSDIADAMILGGLFEKLFSLGITLVATSNIVPDGLYENGLQRQRFLPAIAELKKHCEVVNVDGGVDYRLRTLAQAELYYTPLGEAAEQGLMKNMLKLALGNVGEQQAIIINGRELLSRYSAEDVVWFDFVTLCDGPRSQNDYIELAKLYQAVIVSNVPQMSMDLDDQVRRFINMVDEFYDRGVKLIISAQAGIDQLYLGGKLTFEFERTQSRLLEMQSSEYLAVEHRA